MIRVAFAREIFSLKKMKKRDAMLALKKHALELNGFNPINNLKIVTYDAYVIMH